MEREARNYRMAVNYVALALILQLALNIIEELVLDAVWRATPSLAGDLRTVVYGAAECLTYAAAFLLPALFFFLMAGKGKRAPRTEFCWHRDTLPYLFIGVGIVTAAAVLNGILLDFFDFTKFEETYYEATSASSAAEAFVSLLTLAAVPAFVEEFLFRSVILENLRPYGEEGAILASSLLFGLMHGNPGQFLYATVAGLVFGYIYLKTGNIWCGVLTHFVNNASSVLFTLLAERMTADTATAVSFALQNLFFLLAILSFLYLVSRAGREGKPGGDGAVSHDVLPLPVRVKLFFSPAMLVYVVISAGYTLFILILAVLT